MPKEEKSEPKKKMVVVEEIEEEKKEDAEVIEAPKEEAKINKDEINPDSEINSESFEKTNYLWIIIPTALLIGALVGGLITYFSGISKLNPESTPTPVVTIQPTIQPTPTASPSSTLKKDVLKIQILNGSGVSGAASKAKTLLEGLGYKEIDTGNANMSDLAQTEIAIKDTKKEYLDLIIKDLSKSYTAIEASKALVSTSKYDLVITLGKK